MMGKKNSAGFTLVELMIATAFFGFVLLFVSAGFLQVVRAYNKGIITKEVHETTRNVLEELSRVVLTADSKGDGKIKFAEQDATDPNTYYRFCIGNIRYRWHKGYRKSGDFGLLRSDDGRNCSDPMDAPIELIDDRLAVQNLSIQPIGLDNKTYRISVTISVNSDDGDLLLSNSGAGTKCNISNGDQYCSVATLSTVITLRR